MHAYVKHNNNNIDIYSILHFLKTQCSHANEHNFGQAKVSRAGSVPNEAPRPGLSTGPKIIETTHASMELCHLTRGAFWKRHPVGVVIGVGVWGVYPHTLPKKLMSRYPLPSKRNTPPYDETKKENTTPL